LRRSVNQHHTTVTPRGIIMTTVHAYAATQPGGLLEPFEYELGPMGPDEVDIEVDSCGICHSDLSMLQNDWGMTQYPFVPGHEVSGRVSAAGEQVTHLKVGDHVGLGWHAGYCMTCDQCLGGHHNMCGSAAATIVGRHGGFAVLQEHERGVLLHEVHVVPEGSGGFLRDGRATTDEKHRSEQNRAASFDRSGGLHVALMVLPTAGSHLSIPLPRSG
jgi:hypothetical protein